MPVLDQTTSNSYTGNGVTTVFAYTFKLLDSADVLVTVDGVTKTLTTHYTVSGVGASGGGNITFLAAPANAAEVVIQRDMDYLRETDYQDNGDLLAATLDEDIDRVVMQVQQVRDVGIRSIKIPAGETTDAVMAESAADRAGKVLLFDGSGNPTVGDAYDAAGLAVALAASGGSALLGHIAAGTGAVARTVQSKLRELAISVKDYGAVGNGVADDTAAIQAAMDAAKALAIAEVNYGVTVFFPRGVYKTTSVITVPLYVNVVGETTEGVLILAKFAGDTFQDETTGGASYLYFTRFEEMTILKSTTSGTENTTGKAINFRHNAQYCSFRRLRIYGGEYGIFGENVGYSLWNTFDQVSLYYQTVANMYVGQGSSACRFLNCSFAYAPIGIDFAGTSVGISMSGCAFEGYTTTGIRNAAGNIAVVGGYVEQFTNIPVVTQTGAGQVNMLGLYVKGNGAGQLAKIDDTAGKVRFAYCYIYDFSGAAPWSGTYGSKVELTQNTAGGSSTGTAVEHDEMLTFTPVLLFGAANTGMTGTFLGRYKKRGNRCVGTIYISLTAKGSSTGSCTIDGLPFKIKNTTGASQPCSCVLNTVSTVTHPMPIMNANTTIVSMYHYAAGALAYMNDTYFANTSLVMLSFDYETEL